MVAAADGLTAGELSEEERRVRGAGCAKTSADGRRRTVVAGEEPAMPSTEPSPARTATPGRIGRTTPGDEVAAESGEESMYVRGVPSDGRMGRCWSSGVEFVESL